MYPVDGKLSQKDEFEKVKAEYEKYVLHIFMKKGLDFAGEQSAMEVLLSRLSEKVGGTKIQLLTSPKLHCELAGEGVEYV